MIRPIHNDWPGWLPTWKLWVARWRTAVSGSAELPDRLMLWVDSVGGYLVCLRDEVVLGQPAGGATPDVPILGDISRRQAIVRRQGESYSIEAVREVRVDGRPVQRTAPLWDGSVIDLGEGVRLRFRRPHPLSATARLEFVSRHRTQPSTDAVLLMAEAASWAPIASSHVVAPRLAKRSGSVSAGRPNWAAEPSAKILVDGAEQAGRSTLRPRCRVEGEEFAFPLEPLGDTQ